MVSRPAPLRQRAARRIRHGRRALYRVDVRHRTRARDDSISQDALSVEALEPDWKTSRPNLITAHAVSSESIVLGFPLAQAFTPGLPKWYEFFSPIYGAFASSIG